MKKQILSLSLVLCLLLSLMPMAFAQSNDIVILYENDVHCAADGYAKLKALKDELSATAGYVGVVSSGDYLQGGVLGAFSDGEYMVELMNMVGYDALTLGNHEFDYGMDQLNALVDTMNTKPVCSNFVELATNKPVLQPYTIAEAAGKKIAYIGITTPETISTSNPAHFQDENGNYIYGFCADGLTDFYGTVQNSINAAKDAGAEYVIAIAHLGIDGVTDGWKSTDVIANTTGLDVVLDGHSHETFESVIYKDNNGDNVLLSSTGTKFENIGKLTITADGTMTTELIKTASYDKADGAILDRVAQMQGEYDSMNRTIGQTTVTLTDADENGNWVIRTAETNLGDFCADAFRITTGADIGLQNGGGIRASIPKGEITFDDIFQVFPWGNTVAVVEATGQTIVDLLELGVMEHPETSGGFQQVSGITFKIDNTIESSVVLDTMNNFVKVDGDYRVHDVKVLNGETGVYEPIDLSKTYTVASHSYLLLDQGDGAAMMKDAALVTDTDVVDVDMLEDYIVNYLNGVVGEQYAAPQNRITVEPRQPAITPTDMGDVDGNGQIDAADALLVLKFAVDKWAFTDQEMILADTYADGTIDATDALQVLKFAVNKIDTLPVQPKNTVTYTDKAA